MANNLQEQFLNRLRKDKTSCTVHLTNGFQIRGKIESFDSFVILIRTEDGRQMMVYKHAMSSVTPAEPILIGACAQEEGSR